MVVVFRNLLISSLLLSIVFLILTSALTPLSPQNSPDPPDGTSTDFSYYSFHEEDRFSAMSSTVTSSPLPNGTDPSHYENYDGYEDEQYEPPKVPSSHLMLGVMVGVVALILTLALALMLWRFGASWKMWVQTRTPGVEEP